MRRKMFVAAALIAAGCHRSADGSLEDSLDTSSLAQGWCGVRDTVASSCVSCHSAAAPAGGLDLQTDAFAAIIGVASVAHPDQTYVVANDPDRSYFFTKLAGTQASDLGGVMPPAGLLPQATIDAVRAWIETGATETCDAAADTAQDTIDTGSGDTSIPIDTSTLPGEEWCVVRDVLYAKCESCHTALLPQGGLDLETDPYGAMVNIASHAHPTRTYVVPYEADPSYLVVKIENRQAANEGARMPPVAALAPAYRAAIRAWITAGAPSECGIAEDTSVPTTFHPPGWEARAAHGYAADRQDVLTDPDSLQPARCADCHGADLRGGITGVGCDSCHQTADETTPGEGWRTDCTYCHGGTGADSSGSPPEDVLGQATTASLSFAPHRAHTGETGIIHAPYDCIQCHAKPTDALSSGHFLFPGDSSHPASPTGAIVAENTVTQPGAITNKWGGASITPTGSCTVYCHGTGRSGSNGMVRDTATIATCTACHADATSTETALGAMSGEHQKHVNEGITCSECHADVVFNGQSLVQPPTRHVDGHLDLHLSPPPNQVMTPSGTGTALRCSGACHGEDHDAERWY